jgi:hypothetical protein
MQTELELVREIEKAPIDLSFDDRGLRKSVKYVYGEDGFVNWLEMVDKSELVPFKSVFERRKEPVPKTAEGLPFEDCLILLGGFKKLARLRGFSSVRFNTVSSTMEYIDIECVINWLPNFETGGIPVEFAAKADATITNCDNFAKYYLSAMAENRAFVRAVRNFLNIPILGKDEIGKTPLETGATSVVKATPHSILEELLAERKISFDKLKAKMIKDNLGTPESYSCVKDIPVNLVLDIIGRLKSKS